MNKELPPKFGIAPKLVLLTCIVMSLATAIVGTLLHKSYVSSLQEIEVKRLESKATDLAIAIESIFLACREQTIRIARSPAIHSIEHFGPEAMGRHQLRHIEHHLIRELQTQSDLSEIEIVFQTSQGFKQIAHVVRKEQKPTLLPIQADGQDGYMPFDSSKPVTLPPTLTTRLLNPVQDSEGKSIRISAPILDRKRIPVGSVNVTLNSQSLHDRISLTLQKGENYHLFFGDGTEFAIHEKEPENTTFASVDVFEIQESIDQNTTQPINLITAPSGTRHAIGFSRIPLIHPDGDYIYIAFSEEFDKIIAETSIGSGSAVLAAGTIIGIALIGVWYLASRLTLPLRQIASAARNFNENELAPLPLDSKDEVGVVARSLQEMRDKVRNRENDLKAEIKAHKKTSNDLVVAIRESRQASEAKSNFLATMSHEIRTPMNGVIGMAELLSQTDLSSEQTELLNTICSSGESLLTIINDILDFSKIESNKMDLENEPFDLIQCIEESAELLSTVAHEKDIEIIIDIDSATPRHIRGDMTRVRQVIINFLSNALKFTHEGEVAIRVAPISRSEDSVTLKFEFSDTGVGISEDQKTRLFEAFSQADSSIARKYGGTGLGLAICQKLSELMGGRTWAESELGVGSTFYFTIEAELWPTEIYLAPRLDPDCVNSREVLIIDSNESHSKALRKLLQSWGLKTLVQKEFDGENSAADLIIANRISDSEKKGLIDRASKTDTSVIFLSNPAASKNKEFAGHPNIATIIKPYSQSRLATAIEKLLKDEEESSSTSSTLESEGDSNREFKYRALAVDDNPTNLFCVQELLKRIGIGTDLANGGREALSLCSDNEYDMIFMDLRMPEMDGFQTTKNLFKLYSGRTMPPIIALTANVMPEDQTACENAGMIGFIAKPVKLDNLQSSIKSFVPDFETSS